MMRQAGRYQASYQSLRKNYSFEQLCLNPKLATEVAINAVDEFDFDAAILFSDILYIISAMGPKLHFNPGPQFSYLLREPQDLKKYADKVDLEDYMGFQAEALQLTRQNLSSDKSLIGFTGGPLTLYNFATEGNSKSEMKVAKLGLSNGIFTGFMDKLIPLLYRNMQLQARSNIDVFAMFDSGLSWLSDEDFDSYYYPLIKNLIKEFKQEFSSIPIIYYVKTDSSYILQQLAGLVDAIGTSSRFTLPDIFALSDKIVVQGNLNEVFLSLQEHEFKQKVDEFFDMADSLKQDYKKRWIASLGHGVIPQAKTENIKYFIEKTKNFYF